VHNSVARTSSAQSASGESGSIGGGNVETHGFAVKVDSDGCPIPGIARCPNGDFGARSCCAYRDVRVGWLNGVSAGKRFDAAKLTEIGLRSVENILQIPAVSVALVFTLRERRNGYETEAKHGKKPREFVFMSWNPLSIKPRVVKR
jgi:hypothetical protein